MKFTSAAVLSVALLGSPAVSTATSNNKVFDGTVSSQSRLGEKLLAKAAPHGDGEDRHLAENNYYT